MDRRRRIAVKDRLKIFSKSLDLPGGSGDIATTPDAAATSVTGDIDIRCHAAPDDWTPAANMAFMTKRSGADGNFSWYMLIQTNGTLHLWWTPDGTNASALGKSSTAATGAANGSDLHVRATLNVDAGSTDNDVTFYTSPDGTTWTQLGDVVNTAGTTSIHDGASNLNVGANDTAFDLFAGVVFSAQVYDGIAGTLVGDFNPSRDGTVGASTVTSSTTSEVWTIAGSASIVGYE